MSSTLVTAAWKALGGAPSAPDRISVEGAGSLPSPFDVTGLAIASIGVAGLAAAEHAASVTGDADVAAEVVVDRAVASAWFRSAIEPVGWRIPDPWDPLSGDYRARDGWIRLHTNAPHHRRVAVSVLGVDDERGAVEHAVAGWDADELESAVVVSGGAAARMRSADEWAEHPQGRSVAAEPLVMWSPAGAGSIGPTWSPTSARPLAGIRVLDLTRVIAGPVATRMLAGLGATVLRVDPPSWDEPAVAPDMTLGKRTARIDARTADGMRTLRELLAGADVLVHGYRPGALESLGLGVAVRQDIRPGLVEASIDAYGYSGPWAGRRGFDSLVQMSSGISHAGGLAAMTDAPRPLPVQALDHASGYLLAAAVLRGLALGATIGRGSSWATSLARVGQLLIDSPPPSDVAPVATVADGTSVVTAWGRARMLPPPVTVTGIRFGFDRGSRPIGSDAASWE